MNLKWLVFNYHVTNRDVGQNSKRDVNAGVIGARSPAKGSHAPLRLGAAAPVFHGGDPRGAAECPPIWVSAVGPFASLQDNDGTKPMMRPGCVLLAVPSACAYFASTSGDSPSL